MIMIGFLAAEMVVDVVAQFFGETEERAGGNG